MNSFTNLSPQLLRQAADIQDRISVLQTALGRLLEGAPAAAASGAARRSSGRRQLSAQGLANIRAGAQRRWARFNRARGIETANGRTPARRRNNMSAAGRARIAARMRARWAAAKKAGRNAL